MTLKQLLLGILTLLAIAIMGGSLLSSITQPQIQNRLELYQTNLLLHATEWQPEADADSSFVALQQGITGEDGVKTALKQYKETQESTKTRFEQAQALSELTPVSELNQTKNFLAEVSVKTGILQAETGEIQSAISTWKTVVERNLNSSSTATAQVLIGIWDQPAKILPDAESVLNQNLEGWFRYQALSQLYQLQEREQTLAALQIKEQQIARQALTKLLIVSAIPGIGLLLGTLLLIGLGVQWLLKRKDSVLAQNHSLNWSVPWNWETILQVFLLGFFLVGQLVVPIVFSLVFQSFNLQPATFAPRSQAVYVLVTYLILMSVDYQYYTFRFNPFSLYQKDGFNLIGERIGFCGIRGVFNSSSLSHFSLLN
jgi:hypothetical protein